MSSTETISSGSQLHVIDELHNLDTSVAPFVRKQMIFLKHPRIHPCLPEINDHQDICQILHNKCPECRFL